MGVLGYKLNFLFSFCLGVFKGTKGKHFGRAVKSIGNPFKILSRTKRSYGKHMLLLSLMEFSIKI